MQNCTERKNKNYDQPIQLASRDASLERHRRLWLAWVCTAHLFLSADASATIVSSLLDRFYRRKGLQYQRKPSVCRLALNQGQSLLVKAVLLKNFWDFVPRQQRVKTSVKYSVHIFHAKRHRLQLAHNFFAEKVPTLDRGPSGCCLRIFLLPSSTHHRSSHYVPRADDWSSEERPEPCMESNQAFP